MINFFKVRLLAFAFYIIEKHGLTVVDIHEVAGTQYIVDLEGSFYRIGKEPTKF